MAAPPNLGNLCECVYGGRVCVCVCGAEVVGGGHGRSTDGRGWASGGEMEETGLTTDGITPRAWAWAWAWAGNRSISFPFP